MEQEQKNPKTLFRKNLAMWGIPIAILLGLVILLVVELTSGDKVENEEQSSIVTVIESDDEVIDEESEESGLDPATEQVEDYSDEDDGSLLNQGQDEVASNEMGEVISDEEPPLTVPMSDEEKLELEDSYIVEEGDSLWKIAQKKGGDPWKWKTILIQNNDQINYTIVSAETGEWKVIVDTGKKLTIKSEEKGKRNISFDKTRKKRYAVQLMSLNIDQLEKAVDIVKFLINGGYYAYLYRTPEKIKGQFYYRIRVGFFKTEGDALARGEEIYERYIKRRIFTTDYWAVLPSYRELGGELLDFGIQRNKPWIIHLSQQSSRSDAITTLKSITGFSDFSYISQKRDEEGGFIYRTRVGFFETKKQAEKMLGKIKNSAKGLFKNAQVMEVRHILEAAPGQKTGVSKITEIK
ncbi:MAG: hypothetical protein GY786_01120 [Proteobacteria bacterium]|nr:hypothetical protein [Pseudomonadota bacterium]